MRLTLIDVRERAPSPSRAQSPAGVEALHWQLLTTHQVAGAEPAWRGVGGYQARWCIEPLFRILTSHGLRLEDSQMAAAERLKKLSAAALKAACITLQLVQERDGAHAPPAACVFGDAAIDTIEAWTATLEGKTRRQQNPHPPRRLARARWLAARLGGWNCYAKPAGPLTMHRRPQRFHAIHQGRMLALMPK